MSAETTLKEDGETKIRKELLETGKLRYCFECGICTASCPMAKLLPEHYNPRILLEEAFLDLDEATSQTGLWLCAWCYKCYRRCPQKTKVPEVLASLKDLAAKHHRLQSFEVALQLIRRKIPLPLVCCYACFHPERGEVPKPFVQEALRRFAKEYKREEKAGTASRSKQRKERVAIIGSGPAGLAAALALVRKRYRVTIFERLSVLGGMLKIGLPERRMPKTILETEIQHLKNRGAKFKLGTTVGEDVTINELWTQGYDAVFLGIGAHRSRRLHLEGENLKGVFDALDFLKRVNTGEKVRVGKRVAVIGGGNVAMDSARVALEHGAREVSVLYRRSKEEMPANPWEIQEAEEYDVKLRFLIGPKKILGQNGHVAALECNQMQLGEVDETGRRRPVPVEGSEFTIELDAIITAIGETPDLSLLPKGVDVTEANTISVDPITFQTSLPGLFAGGDAVSGPATVIEAVLTGTTAAASIDRYLRSKRSRTRKRRTRNPPAQS